MIKINLSIALIIVCIFGAVANPGIEKTSLKSNPHKGFLNSKGKKEIADYSMFADNKFKGFIGIGNNNLFADIVTLKDKSFAGELGFQVRGGIRLSENYEVNFGIYGRQIPNHTKYPQLTYNKLLGFSGALVYEFRRNNSRWGMPFGIEILKYNKSINLNLSEGTVFKENYNVLAFGPKIGARYHLSNLFFLETEVEFQIEHFTCETNYIENTKIDANEFGSFKFFNISINRSF